MGVAVTSVLGTLSCWRTSVLATGVGSGLWALADLLNDLLRSEGFLAFARMEYWSAFHLQSEEHRDAMAQVPASAAAVGAAQAMHSRAAHAIAAGYNLQPAEAEDLDLEASFQAERGGALSMDSSCCIQTVAFLLAPPVAITFFRFCLLLLKSKDVYNLWLLLTAVGAMYWPATLFLVVRAAGRRPHLVPVRGPNGFPLVRNLSAREHYVHTGTCSDVTGAP